MNIQVKNVSEELHERLRRCASRRGTTLRVVILEAIDREVSHDEFVNQLRRRAAVETSRPAGAVLEEVRDERLGELPPGLTSPQREA